ncbi:LOW QUALITY PROTEIN: thymidylate kinase [Halarchaeum acidiphilum MH1-52-1]|uniref:Probable thymidylate kinase n=1 Tax=Halarchaeum acidiphilum MH1-52-1 TaxID=1261545 RepID=U2YFP3_9EURY|nr:LOW QUALITY PROTEIN: thymidylate kinase [Halarchaeum acidiphilum MH1-52-1]
MLVTLEGIDGSGKTTAWGALRETRDDGYTFTREPTDSWYGEAVLRSVRDDDADPLAEAFLYTADHAAHLSRTVRPALERGDVVVSDRYSDSRYAYQASPLDGVLDDPLDYVRRVHEPWTRPPDCTLYFDIDPEIAAERAGATNKFEQAAFLERVRENYEELIAAEPERFVRIDAEQPLDDVRERVEAVLDERVD